MIFLYVQNNKGRVDCVVASTLNRSGDSCFNKVFNVSSHNVCPEIFAYMSREMDVSEVIQMCYIWKACLKCNFGRPRFVLVFFETDAVLDAWMDLFYGDHIGWIAVMFDGEENKSEIVFLKRKFKHSFNCCLPTWNCIKKTNKQTWFQHLDGFMFILFYLWHLKLSPLKVINNVHINNVII